MEMLIDIVGTCNLKCPSCPMGNSENNNYKKPMPIDVFSSIIKKANIKINHIITLTSFTTIILLKIYKNQQKKWLLYHLFI